MTTRCQPAVPATLLVLLALAAGPAHAQSFDSFNVRGNGRSLALLRGAGDWQVGAGYTFTFYGAEVEWGRTAVRFATGDVNGLPGDGRKAHTLGADHAVPVGYGIPVLVSLGVDYSHAAERGSDALNQLSFPLLLSNNATVDFGTVWFHPTIVVGGSLHRTTQAGASTSGVRPEAATGLEAGHGRVSLRLRLRHNLSAPQRGELAVRLGF